MYTLCTHCSNVRKQTSLDGLMWAWLGVNGTRSARLYLHSVWLQRVITLGLCELQHRRKTKTLIGLLCCIDSFTKFALPSFWFITSPRLEAAPRLLSTLTGVLSTQIIERTALQLLVCVTKKLKFLLLQTRAVSRNTHPHAPTVAGRGHSRYMPLCFVKPLQQIWSTWSRGL